jgi:hypothetical protein
MGGILYHTALLAPSLQDADPWTYGAGYSVKPVAMAIKIKHAGFNPYVLGSVHAGGKPGQRDALVQERNYEQRKNFSAALAMA